MSGKTMDARLKRLESLKEQINDGVGIRAALSSMGYTGKSAGQAYRQMKNLAKEHDPALYARLPEKISDVGAPVAIRAENEPDAVLGRPKTDFEPATVKVDGPIRIETPEANRVEIVEVPEKQIGGLCPPPDEDNKFIFQTVAVRNKKLGTFYYDEKHGTIDWRHPYGEEISLYPEDYMLLRDSIDMILHTLGVKV